MLRASIALLALVASPLAAQRQPRAPIITLGAPTASPTNEFSAIAGVLELSRDRVVVADPRDRRLTLLDLSSGAARPLGRVGSGPGEYRAIGDLIPRPDGGGGYLVDFALRRLLPIADDASFGTPIAFPVAILLRGADRSGTIFGDGLLPRQGASLPDSMWILRWDPATTQVDTLMKYNAGVSWSVRKPGESRPVWPALDTWAVLPGGEIAVIEAQSYRLTVWREGKPLRSAVIPWQPRRVSDADRDAYLQLQKDEPVRVMGQSGGRDPQVARNAPRYEFAREFPPFGDGGLGGRYLWVAPRGDIWIERLISPTDSVPRYDVVDGARGTLLRQVTLPVRSRLVGVTAGSVYVAEPDANDLAYLRRYAYPR